jgi:acyl carrier protein
VSDEIREKVIHLVAERMGVEPDQITADTHFVNDLQSDSLDMAELVIDLEEEFDISISDEEAQKIETVGQAIQYISENQQQ